METLHGLVDKGVKVELGIPYELWDEPSVEVTLMKKQVGTILHSSLPVHVCGPVPVPAYR